MMKNDALPKEWRKVKLGQFGTFYKGRGITKADLVECGIPCLRYAEIYTKYDGVVNELSSSVSPDAATKATPIQSGDIIFAASGETAAEIGKAIAFVGCGPAVAGGDTVIFRDHGQEPAYLVHALNDVDAARQKARLGKGQSVVHIHVPELFQVEVSLPPLHEQRKIAETLATWDTAIEKTESLIAAKEKQFKWLLKTLISDQQDNSGWRRVKLGELGLIHSGGTPSTRDSSNWNGDIFWLTPSEVTRLSEKYIASTERQITQKGLSHTTLLPKNCLIVCTRATIGDCCINTVPMAINQGFKCIHPHKEYSVTFLYYTFQLLKAQLVRVSCGNTFGEVSKKDFANILISVPSLFEQKAIAAYLNAAQQEIITLKQLAEQYRTQNRGLMQKLLTGKWRVKDEKISCRT